MTVTPHCSSELFSTADAPGAASEDERGVMLDIRGLTKAFRDGKSVAPVVKDLSVAVTKGEVLSLVGPSGCGKTTTLRCVAGLESPDAGEILIDGQPVFSTRRGGAVAAHHRPIGMVFQSYAVWPHLTVFENVAYPLRHGSARYTKREIAHRVGSALELLGIEALADRRPSMLSGGQQQRVAIARALLREAKVLLFDEPLSNLDAKFRESMRAELRELFKKLDVAVLYVTHDLQEALVLSDSLVVMRDGEIIQQGTPEEIYSQPRSAFVARFLGNCTVFDAELRETAAGKVAESALGSVPIASRCHLSAGRVGLVVRPEFVAVSPAGTPPVGGSPCITGRITASLFHGTSIEYHVRLDGGEIVARGPVSGVRLTEGDVVDVHVDASGVIVVPADGGTDVADVHPSGIGFRE